MSYQLVALLKRRIFQLLLKLCMAAFLTLYTMEKRSLGVLQSCHCGWIGWSSTVLCRLAVSPCIVYTKALLSCRTTPTKSSNIQKLKSFFGERVSTAGIGKNITQLVWHLLFPHNGIKQLMLCEWTGSCVVLHASPWCCSCRHPGSWKPPVTRSVCLTCPVPVCRRCHSKAASIARLLSLTEKLVCISKPAYLLNSRYACTSVLFFAVVSPDPLSTDCMRLCCVFFPASQWQVLALDVGRTTGQCSLPVQGQE